jgi:hypothetical protein
MYTTEDCSLLLKDGYSECQGTKASVNRSDLVIFDIYLPSVSSCPRTYNPDLSSVLNFSEGDIIIHGDFNAHHEGWNLMLPNLRGQKISDSVGISLLIISNEDVPMHLSSNGSPSYPDITMALAHVALAFTWATHISMNSDHLLITISLPSKQAPPHCSQKTFTNFKKVDWPMFVP